MKIFCKVALLFIFFIGTAQLSAQQTNYIQVIDFHSTNRCMTCNAIENNTAYTLKTYFSKELKDATIIFSVVNVDLKENEALAEKFEASGTSLFLNVVKEGKESKIDLTNFAFMKGNKKEVFAKELQAKLKKQLLTL